MNVVVWVVQGVLAIAFLLAGGMKLARDRKVLADSGMGWARDISDSAVRAIGAAEVLGAIGLVLPAAIGIAPVLTPIAATALALLMAGAATVHVRRAEVPQALPSIVLLVLAAFVAVERFGPLAL